MTSKPQIIIVDDNEDVAEFVCDVAEDMGFEVKSFHTGGSFVDAYASLNPCGIVLDLNIPEYDGVELMRFLGERQASASIFIASGTDVRTLNAAEELGRQHKLEVAGSIPKPITIEALREAFTPLLTSDRQLGPDDIREALRNGHIVPFFQPKVDLSDSETTRIVGVEALVRWKHPDKGMIFPDQFLPLVAAHSLMNDMTQEVVKGSLKALRDWKAAGHDIAMAFNVDGSMLGDLTFPNRLSDLAREYGIAPDKITIEITETAVMADVGVATEILTRLRLKGFNLSIDDFGTGYSSLVQLYRMPFNELKIDRSFVFDIGKNPEAGIIIELLTELAKKLSMKVCAEGIEDLAMLSFVRQAGCDLGQGYLFSKPVSADDLSDQLGI